MTTVVAMHCIGHVADRPEKKKKRETTMTTMKGVMHHCGG
jgi:hypothetical protein